MDEMEEYFEGRWKWKEKISKLSNSSSTSRQVDIYSCSAGKTSQASGLCDPCLARTNLRHSKLGAKPKWRAHADWSNQSGEDSAVSTTIPPWRNQSHWRITTTQTVEGLAGQPKYGVQQQYESLREKHATEYTKLVEEYEYWKVAGNEKKEDFEAREKGWKGTLEELLSLVKDVHGNASANGQQHGKRAEEGQKKSHHLKEGERRSTMRKRSKAPVLPSFLASKKECGRITGEGGATIP